MGVVRILSYDGGGVRGPIATYPSKELEKELGPLAQYFHFVTGTSTGGLIATGLSEISGAPLMSASQLHDMYMSRAGDIFDDTFSYILKRALDPEIDDSNPNSRVGMAIKRITSKLSRGNGYLFGAEYNPEVLAGIVREIVGDQKLSDIDNNLILTSLSEKRDTQVYKSWKAIGRSWSQYEADEKPKDFDAYLSDILMATTAAPTYFPPHPVRNMVNEPPTYHVDGGLWANNPAQVALSAARNILGTGHQYLVVSIGTGDPERNMDLSTADRWSKLWWAKPVISMQMDASAQAVDYHMAHDSNVAYFRFQTDLRAREGDPIPSDDFDDGSPENMEALEIRGQRLYEDNRDRFDKLTTYFQKTEKRHFKELCFETNASSFDEHPIKREIMELLS